MDRNKYGQPDWEPLRKEVDACADCAGERCTNVVHRLWYDAEVMSQLELQGSAICVRAAAVEVRAMQAAMQWVKVEDGLPDDAAEFPFLDFDGEIVVGFIGYDEQDGTEYLSIRNPDGAHRKLCDPYNYELWLPVAVPLSPFDRAMQAEALAAYEAEATTT